MNDLLLTLGVALGIQVVFFAFAAALKTDKVTDLSYSLTFIIIAAYLFSTGQTSLVVASMVGLWGLRLATYLLVRIIRMKRDKRFDGIREDFFRFAKFWLLQGVAVWVIMLPVTLGGTSWMWFGIALWALGLVIETVADWQKYCFKEKNKQAFTNVGLWKYARHPNYFGEMLVWWGVFFTILPVSGWAWAGIVGPLFITILLRYGTGVPPLEKHMQERYGKDSKFKEYVKNTRLLVPLPK